MVPVASQVLVKVRPSILAVQQRRTILNWLTNYPDRILELKKIHQAGGRKIFTWQKQPQDKYVNFVGLVLGIAGVVQLVPAFYRLATGKGKIED
ncbi:hypothetical protein ACA910_016679 [Epithemia clementina (nom. ined.)]